MIAGDEGVSNQLLYIVKSIDDLKELISIVAAHTEALKFTEEGVKGVREDQKIIWSRLTGLEKDVAALREANLISDRSFSNWMLLGGGILIAVAGGLAPELLKPLLNR